MFGLKIFIATLLPFLRMPLWTWATEAAAIGFFSKKLNISLISLFISSSIILIATSLEKGGSLSCNRINLLATFKPNISGLVDNACPSLTNPGPISPKLLTNFVSIFFFSKINFMILNILWYFFLIRFKFSISVNKLINRNRKFKSDQKKISKNI